MFGFLNSCGFCSGQPQAGQYAFEAFNKVPLVGGLLGNLSQLVNIGNIAKSIGGGGLGQIGNLIGGGFGGLGGIGGFGGIGGNQPNQQNIGGGGLPFDISKFINNVPLSSVTEGNFSDIVNNNSNAVVKKILKSNYADLMKSHKESGQKWTDPDFPPDQSSIGNVEDLKMKATWKRVTDIIKNPEFVGGKIEPSDIFQGSLGDCYFLSAISALAENDFRIKNLFPTLQINPYGIYMARILHRGVLREVVVDDYIPVDQHGQPLFAKPAGGKQIWVMILQKCWAKLNGSYGSIVGGLPNEVLHAFSGAPTFYRQVPTGKQKQDQLWNDMWSAYEKGGILCCGTKGDDDIEKYGFVKGHAYTILNLYQQPYKMVKLRNPWGEKEWQGRASDNDNKFWSQISPADKQRLGYTSKNDGTFFLLWEDFVNYYDMVDICKINDNASFANVEAQFDRKNANMFEFQTNGGNITLTLSQQNLRGKGQAAENKGYSRSIMIVARNDEAAKGYEYKYVNSGSNRLFAQHTLQLTNLEKGKYVVYAKYDWIDKNLDSASLGVYTDNPANLVKVKQSSHDKFLFKVFLDHARKNSKKQVLNQSPSEWICSDLLLRQCGYGYIAVHLDQKSTRKLGLEINENDFTGKRFSLKKPYKGQGQIKTTIEAGKQLIILFHIKGQSYPSSVSLPSPKIYNLV